MIQTFKWTVVKSALLEGLEIVVLGHKEHYHAARKAHPDLVVYFQEELDLIEGLDPESVKVLHKVKQRFNGFIVPGLLEKDLRASKR